MSNYSKLNQNFFEDEWIGKNKNYIKLLELYLNKTNNINSFLDELDNIISTIDKLDDSYSSLDFENLGEPEDILMKQKSGYIVMKIFF